MSAANSIPLPALTGQAWSASDVVLDYHLRSMHTRQGYAAGPGAVDWDCQPDPFRHWHFTRRYSLPRELSDRAVRWSQLSSVRPAAALDLANLSTLLRLTAGLTAWKEQAGARWSLRVHPSAGNLHPTETWVIAQWVDGLPDGLYHYQVREHALEWRAGRITAAEQPGLWIGFSSVFWRGAWKYGERAFRYCQLDLGHVLAALAYAATLLGWRAQLLVLPSEDIAHCLGLDRSLDYSDVEPEDAAALIALQTDAMPPLKWDEWSGLPSRLDYQPKLQWPVIDRVAEATRGAVPATTSPKQTLQVPDAAPSEDVPPEHDDPSALQVILQRRSAQGFVRHCPMPLETFHRLLKSMLPGGSPAWSLWPLTPRVHPILMVHQVAGLRPGLYCLLRDEGAREALQKAMRAQFEWLRVEAELPLYRLVAARCVNMARILACNQHIAADSAVTFLFVAEFARPLGESPAAYRHLHWEAGMLAHAATLVAEAAGWRGTGIGCFFDDLAHEVLGLADASYQVLYLCAVGQPRTDRYSQIIPVCP